MINILILASIACAGLGQPVAATALFCIAAWRFERRKV